MTLPIIPTENELALRQTISQLRHEVETVTLAYLLAREQWRCQDVTALLRRRSALIDSLIRMQKRLFHLLGADRTEPSRAFAADLRPGERRLEIHSPSYEERHEVAILTN